MVWTYGSPPSRGHLLAYHCHGEVLERCGWKARRSGLNMASSICMTAPTPSERVILCESIECCATLRSFTVLECWTSSTTYISSGSFIRRISSEPLSSLSCVDSLNNVEHEASSDRHGCRATSCRTAPCRNHSWHRGHERRRQPPSSKSRRQWFSVSHCSNDTPRQLLLLIPIPA